MPYTIEKHDGHFKVITNKGKDNEKVHSKHTTKEKAEAQVKLLRAIEHNPDFKKKNESLDEKIKDKKVPQANFCPECHSAGSGHTATCSKYNKLKESNITRVLSILEAKESYTITRKNPKTGFDETIQYSGSKANIPKGWKLKESLDEAEGNGYIAFYNGKK